MAANYLCVRPLMECTHMPLQAGHALSTLNEGGRFAPDGERAAYDEAVIGTASNRYAGERVDTA